MVKKPDSTNNALQVVSGMTFFVNSTSGVSKAQLAAQQYQETLSSPDKVTRLLTPIFFSPVTLVSMYNLTANETLPGRYPPSPPASPTITPPSPPPANYTSPPPLPPLAPSPPSHNYTSPPPPAMPPITPEPAPAPQPAPAPMTPPPQPTLWPTSPPPSSPLPSPPPPPPPPSPPSGTPPATFTPVALFRLPWETTFTYVVTTPLAPCFGSIAVSPSSPDPSVTYIDIDNSGMGDALMFYPRDATTKQQALAKKRYFTVAAVFKSPARLSSLKFEVTRGGDSTPRGIYIQGILTNTTGKPQMIEVGEQLVASSTKWIDVKYLLPSNVPVIGLTFKIYGWAPNERNAIEFRRLKVYGSCEKKT